MYKRDASRSRSRSRSGGRRSRCRSRGSRSRRRSRTPDHWRSEAKRTISLAEFEKKKKEKKRQEEEREQREEESHLLEGSCTVYGDIRERYGDLEDDDDLVDFFNEILARREELDARGLEEQALEVEPNTSDDASLGNLPGQASMGT